MRFEFATANRILFGQGALKEAGGIAREFGARALIVTGRTVSRAQGLLAILRESGIAPDVFSVPGEPTTDMVREGVTRAREIGCELVVGFGGGSALDAGKAIAALLTNEGDLFDYLEVIGRCEPLSRPSAPYVAIPTTAGTGTEVTRNAVITSPQHQVKVSMRSARMLPRVALVDPELIYDLPPSITACTGLDAVTQLIEPFVSLRANPLTDAVCREGLQRAARSLLRAFQHGEDVQACEDMSVASLMGGLALANAGLGVVHGIASPLGGMFCAPHGAICAALLPHAMAVNVEALQRQQPDGDALHRYDAIARILTGDSQATANDAVAWVTNLCRALQIPPLSAYGVTRDSIPTLVAKASASSSVKGNPVPLTPEELREIIQRAL